ncbi:hypothetical protein EG68_07499 [Paragonimus skrjabini miyazakii]|uniref:Protein zwilch n=1 Tax=Paragonimus skrjabini miyazakii TaxID=59628 RepID=A0A8S9YWN3_9TREM|nr:hypothetical protein EG68_07499 [Paragonimus skrjabini miyazakii]
MIGLIEREFGLSCKAVVFDEESPTFKDEEQNVQFVCQHKLNDCSVHQNFSGNPLELEEIVNLSLESKLIVEPDRKQIPGSQFINVFSMKPLKSIPDNAYLDSHMYCVSGLSGSSANDYQLFGVFKLTPSSKKVLRIKIVTDPDLYMSINNVRRIHMAMFPSFSTDFEATYAFPFASLSVQFDTSNEQLLCPPLSFVTGTLTSEIKPYESCFLPSVSEDFKLLKSIVAAYESDCSVWQTAREPVTLAAFQSSLPLLFKGDSIQVIALFASDTQTCDAISPSDICSIPPFRHLDSTERLWNAIKTVHSRQTFRELVNCATHYLLKHRELLKLHRGNHTQLATRLRTLLSSHSPIDLDSSSTFPYGIECLLEIGLNKLTNDCISVLETVIPDCVPAVDDKAKIVELPHRWAQLHHLYKASCFFLSLSPYCSKQIVIREVRAILNQPDPKGEWRMGLFEDPSRGPLVVTRRFNLPLSELLVPLSSIPPSLWIMRMDADAPVRTSVRLVYEHVPTRDGVDQYICHEMRLTDSYWPNGIH